jgi:hypothetical protein
MRRVRGFTIVLTGLVVLYACLVDQSQATPLKDHAAWYCSPGHTPVVSYRPERGYVMMKSPGLDSAALLKAFEIILPPRHNKVVMIDTAAVSVDASRWIVFAIEKHGGAAYKLDAICFREPASPRQAFWWP